VPISEANFLPPDSAQTPNIRCPVFGQNCEVIQYLTSALTSPAYDLFHHYLDPHPHLEDILAKHRQLSNGMFEEFARYVYFWASAEELIPEKPSNIQATPEIHSGIYDHGLSV